METINVDNIKAQMRKGILEYCILSILSKGDAYVSDIINELKDSEMIVVEGTLYDTDALNELAKIPSRDELISKLLGSLQSPITNFARVIKQIAEQGGEAAPAEAAEETATDAE